MLAFSPYGKRNVWPNKLKMSRSLLWRMTSQWLAPISSGRWHSSPFWRECVTEEATHVRDPGSKDRCKKWTSVPTSTFKGTPQRPHFPEVPPFPNTFSVQWPKSLHWDCGGTFQIPTRSDIKGFILLGGGILRDDQSICVWLQLVGWIILEVFNKVWEFVHPRIIKL